MNIAYMKIAHMKISKNFTNVYEDSRMKIAHMKIAHMCMYEYCTHVYVDYTQEKKNPRRRRWLLLRGGGLGGICIHSWLRVYVDTIYNVHACMKSGIYRGRLWLCGRGRGEVRGVDLLPPLTVYMCEYMCM